MMRELLTLCGIFLTILCAFLLAGVGIGVALNWILPAVDFGIAVLIGCLLVPTTLYCTFQFSTSLEWAERMMELDAEIEAEESNSEGQAAIEFPSPKPRSKRRSKRS